MAAYFSVFFGGAGCEIFAPNRSHEKEKRHGAVSAAKGFTAPRFSAAPLISSTLEDRRKALESVCDLVGSTLIHELV